MKAWIGAVLVMSALMLSAPAAFAASSGVAEAKAVTSRSVYFGDRRVHRRYPAYPAPAYYARPYYYRPYPYGAPAPFFLGFGYLPYY